MTEAADAVSSALFRVILLTFVTIMINTIVKNTDKEI